MHRYQIGDVVTTVENRQAEVIELLTIDEAGIWYRVQTDLGWAIWGDEVLK